MGQNSSKEATGTRKKSFMHWDSSKSSSNASSYGIDQCTPCPTLIRRNKDLAALEKPAVGRIDKVLNYCKRKISRKESSSTAQTGILSTDMSESFSVISSKQPEVRGLNELVSCTKFSREELQLMYRGFKNECPSGVVDWDTFKKIYAELFPCGDSLLYARFIFNTFDRNRDGKITFENFAIGLSKSMHGSLDEKLKWTFQLYDLNNDGILTKKELIQVLDAVSRVTPLQVSTESPDLCSSGNPALEEQVEETFEAIDQDGDGMVTESEFIEACLKDASLLESLTIANHFNKIGNMEESTNVAPRRRKYSEHVNRHHERRKLHRMGSLPDLRHGSYQSNDRKYDIFFGNFLKRA